MWLNSAASGGFSGTTITIPPLFAPQLSQSALRELDPIKNDVPMTDNANNFFMTKFESNLF